MILFVAQAYEYLCRLLYTMGLVAHAKKITHARRWGENRSARSARSASNPPGGGVARSARSASTPGEIGDPPGEIGEPTLWCKFEEKTCRVRVFNMRFQH